MESYDSHPPGFGFNPTDEQLVSFYLVKKVLDSSFTCRANAEVDLNKYEPWQLPEKAKTGEKEWYFYSLRERKYPTGLRTNPATSAGNWKVTGNDRKIYSSETQSLVGIKKTLVFYRGKAPKGEKTNWVMHEFRLQGKFAYPNISTTSKNEWVISRLFQKKTSGSTVQGASTTAASSSTPTTTVYERCSNHDDVMNPSIKEEHLSWLEGIREFMADENDGGAAVPYESIYADWSELMADGNANWVAPENPDGVRMSLIACGGIKNFDGNDDGGGANWVAPENPDGSECA